MTGWGWLFENEPKKSSRRGRCAHGHAGLVFAGLEDQSRGRGLFRGRRGDPASGESETDAVAAGLALGEGGLGPGGGCCCWEAPAGGGFHTRGQAAEGEVGLEDAGLLQQAGGRQQDLRVGEAEALAGHAGG